MALRLIDVGNFSLARRSSRLSRPARRSVAIPPSCCPVGSVINLRLPDPRPQRLWVNAQLSGHPGEFTSALHGLEHHLLTARSRSSSGYFCRDSVSSEESEPPRSPGRSTAVQARIRILPGFRASKIAGAVQCSPSSAPGSGSWRHGLQHRSPVCGCHSISRERLMQVWPDPAQVCCPGTAAPGR